MDVDEVQDSRIIPITSAHPIQRAASGIGSQVRKWKKADWCGVLLASGLVIWAISKAMQPAMQPQVIENPLKPQAFDSAQLSAEQEADAESAEANLTAFSVEQHQRAVVSIANGYKALATQYIQTPNHKCFGATVRSCLNTFWQNRSADFERILVAPQKAKYLTPQSVVVPHVRALIAQANMDALRLAIVLEIPPAHRSGWQQQLIDTQYPLLSEGAGEELKPQPAIALSLLRQRERREREALSLSAEEQAKTQYQEEKKQNESNR